jgi:hypothetical protein
MRWTQKETDIAIDLLQQKKTYDEIAKKLNTSKGSVRNKLQKLGYTFSKEQKETRTCGNCDITFIVGILNPRKFCGSSCAAKFSNKFRYNKLTHPKYSCLQCSEKIYKGRKYCSNVCANKHHKEEFFNKIENGDVTLNEKHYKDYLKGKYGNKCMECEWNKINPITGNVPIQLEHMDGNSDNNSLDNLKLLCPNCHSLTPTYGALNKGNGRDSKRNKLRQQYRANNTNVA